VLVERDLAITLFPGMLDIWRLPLDGSGRFERLTTFDHHAGFGANNPVVSPDGSLIAFGLKVEGEEGEGDGILLLDLAAPVPAPDGPPAPAPAAPASPGVAGDQLPATGSTTTLAVAGGLVALALLVNRFGQSRSKRSRFMTLSHAATKSRTNFSPASSEP
jgi:LPXTG-motif cell wall-anchored protein